MVDSTARTVQAEVCVRLSAFGSPMTDLRHGAAVARRNPSPETPRRSVSRDSPREILGALVGNWAYGVVAPDDVRERSSCQNAGVCLASGAAANRVSNHRHRGGPAGI